MKGLYFVTVLFLLASCRSSRTAVEASDRSLEMTDRLESIHGRQIDRVLTTETIIMKPDTVTGKLTVAQHTVVKTTETVRDTSTAVTTAKTEAVEESMSETKEATVNAKADAPSWIVPAVFLGSLILAIVLTFDISKQQGKWTLRH